ncbi:hypothetical protein EB796_015237 [Bugula neritina]|uniref:Uncharacterized protein n=1 Tax=Bugula neritina TaxID=10212 RepID=A0A7J7JKU5_BUGNE|nr:hypothetical protein EB796_015237 [Bugula neritina]
MADEALREAAAGIRDMAQGAAAILNQQQRTRLPPHHLMALLMWMSFYADSNRSEYLITKRGLPEGTYTHRAGQLRTRYQLTEQGASQLLKQVSWNPKENIHEFANYLKRLIQMAIPELGEDGRMKRTIKELINALPDEYQTLRWELNHRTPETVEATIDIIHQFSQLQPNTTTVRQVKNDSMVELEARLDQYMAQQNKMMQKLIETQGAMLEKLTLSTASVQSRPPRTASTPVTCYACGERGHMQGDVRNLGRETN